jgi:hypothetical protein
MRRRDRFSIFSIQLADLGGNPLLLTLAIGRLGIGWKAFRIAPATGSSSRTAVPAVRREAEEDVAPIAMGRTMKPTPKPSFHASGTSVSSDAQICR